jgi:SMI1 / KNR4 family (SUKH-1)
MDDILKKLIEKMGLNPPTTSSALTDVEAKLRIKLPNQYIDFMMESNGAEGNIGRSYIAIWAAEQIVQLNEGYAVNGFTPGLVYFGSDGGGMAYAFDNRTENVSIVVIPFESIHIEDAKTCGKTFVEFLLYLFNE